ncbi:hypothetical protein KR222_001687, partial [Zaprionus bogoriensis]
RPALPSAASLLGAKINRQAQEDEEAADTDNPALHGGRIRSFKHERGNWATFVFVPVGACAFQLDTFQAAAILKLAPHIELQASEPPLHLSLSRTVVLQHHQVSEFSRSLQKVLNSCAGYLRVYTNEERTRTFLAVQLDRAYTAKTCDLLRPIDVVMRDFRLPQFYEQPSFHVSLLWCVGDYQQLLQDKIEELQHLLDEHELLKLDVNEVHCKSGNKHFIYKLK